jgi:hypothetical protein
MANDPKDPRSKDPDRDRKTDPNQNDLVPGPSEDSKRSGRVGFDSRGNSVWEWQLETGVYSRDVNTQKLKKLDLGDLSIAETGIQKRPPGLEDEPQPGGGFNPYDNAPKSKEGGAGFNPYDNARNLGDKFAPKAVPPKERPPPRTPDELRKLSEWIKMKKNLDKK